MKKKYEVHLHIYGDKKPTIDIQQSISLDVYDAREFLKYVVRHSWEETHDYNKFIMSLITFCEEHYIDHEYVNGKLVEFPKIYLDYAVLNI